ncbi:MAG TPA: potassium channel family protein [Gaiellaceae bacterium]|nr:potassium channel family protein [Gaiellaceae bacterium]
MSTRMERRVETWYERLSLKRAVGSVIVVALTLVLIAGALERIVEPEVFTSLGVAYWWAVVTVTTVGYGDVVPKSSEGRVVAAGLMLTGLALIPTLTSLIVSSLISKRRQSDQDRIEQLEHEQAVVLERIEQRLERLEQRQ